ncbi:MAG: hypothetical protein ABH879_02560 [archaeon]
MEAEGLLCQGIARDSIVWAAAKAGTQRLYLRKKDVVIPSARHDLDMRILGQMSGALGLRDIYKVQSGHYMVDNF